MEEGKLEFTREEMILVRKRLDAMPSDLRFITLGKTYSKEDLIKEFESGTGLGARIAVRELSYVNRLWVRQ